MAVYFVTGKLGSGKSLITVGKIQDYLNQGRMVATNLDLFPEHLINPWAKQSQIYRLPDKPSSADLESLPAPYDGDYDEDASGLIVLDECGTWFNARDYRDKTRSSMIDTLLHIRKRGWDVMFIVQHFDMVDTQARNGLGELVVHCRRLDRLRVPFIGVFLGGLGIDVRPPKIHFGIVKYGSTQLSPTVERWVYRGTDLYRAYDTRQLFGASDCALHSVLPPWYVYGRYVSKREHKIEEVKIYGTRLIQSLSARAVFLIGLVIGGIGVSLYGGDQSTVIAAAHAETQQTAATDEQQPEPAAPPVVGVRISAAVYANGGESLYIFEKNETTWYPEQYGYTVQWITHDRARLQRDGEYVYVRDYPYTGND